MFWGWGVNLGGMRCARGLVLLAFVIAAALPAAADPDIFVARPYLQLGDNPREAARERMDLLWETPDEAAAWEVEVRAGATGAWRAQATPTMRRVAALAPVAAFRAYRATLRDLAPGERFAYRIRRDGREVFASSGRARKHGDAPYRFVLTGDTAAGTDGERAVVYQAYKLQPDFLLIAGDIVYPRGRLHEYRAHFHPIYNADVASPQHGAPLARSVMLVAAPGNHDLGTARGKAVRNLAKYPDAMAYFYEWDQPLDGPAPPPSARKVSGPAPLRATFLGAAGDRFPRMASFSFDYGNAHWTVLDSNDYMDWSQGTLREWVRNDIRASDKRWHFVAFHHPGFQSSRAHLHEQRMRRLSPLFEELGVDVVFAGHVHNYQRSRPLTFVPGKVDANGDVSGDMVIDRAYDGRTKTRPRGVIYVVSGAGGAALYDRDLTDRPQTWLPFTAAFRSDRHSITVVDVSGSRLTLRQVDQDGREIDRIVVTK